MFVYYTEKQDVTREFFVDAGLGYAFEDPSFSRQQVMKGPNERGAGSVCGRTAAGLQINKGFVWEIVPKTSPEIFVGFDGSKPFDPKTIMRPDPVPGNVIQIDGRDWMIPKARTADADLGLVDLIPRGLKWTGDEFVNGDPSNQELHGIATSIWESFMGSEDNMISMPDDIEHLICKLFAMNYFIGPTELCLLNVLTNSADRLWELASQVVDMPAVLEWSEKKQLASQH